MIATHPASVLSAMCELCNRNKNAQHGTAPIRPASSVRDTQKADLVAT